MIRQRVSLAVAGAVVATAGLTGGTGRAVTLAARTTVAVGAAGSVAIAARSAVAVTAGAVATRTS